MESLESGLLLKFGQNVLNVTYVLSFSFCRCTTASQSSTGPCCYCQSRRSQVPCVKAVAKLQTSFAVWKFPVVSSFLVSWFRDLEFFFMPPFHHFHHFHRSLFCSPKSNKLSERDHQPGRKPIFIIFIILYILWDLLHFLVHLFRCFKQTGIWQQAPSSILSLLWSALERLKA